MEIERKFLVRGTAWKSAATAELCRQGYICRAEERTVRVRVLGDRGYLTLKGATHNFSRLEYEYEIPKSDAEAMLESLCEKPLVEKIRYKLEYAGRIWEIDEFLGDNKGLVVAEVELDSEDQNLSLPEWVEREVSDDKRYFNANLVENPYLKWGKKA